MGSKSVARLVLTVVGVVVLAFAVLSMVGWLTQPLRTADGIRERVADPDNVIYQYEHFHDLCGSIASTDEKIALKQVEIDVYDKRHPNGDESDRYQAAPKRDRLDTDLAGLRQHRADLKAKYNGDSVKINRSLFKADELPDRIEDQTPVCN